MVGTIKRSIGRDVVQKGEQWDNIIDRVVFGYRRRPNRARKYPFELLYEVKPMLLPSDRIKDTTRSVTYCKIELLALRAPELQGL